MARIRSIKPQFFKSEELAALSAWHRLAYQGLWCYADREGRLRDRPRLLKVEIFPFDDLDMDGLLWDLQDAGFIIRYSVEDHNYIEIPTFLLHQFPKKDEHASNYPACEDIEKQRRNRNGTAAVPTLLGGGTAVGNRTLGNRTLGHEEGADAPPRSRAEDLVEAWNAITTPPIARCRELSAGRRRHISARLKERRIEEWREVIATIEASDFCHGKNDRGWRATFDWLVESSDTAVKVLEGKYENREVSSKQPVSAAEYAKAEKYRQASWGRCPHDPKCGQYADCVNAIAVELRTATGAA